LARRGPLYGGFLLIGVGVGFILSFFMDYSFGMPAGVLIGMGLGIIADYLIHERRTK